jgi:hypothetical protein
LSDIFKGAASSDVAPLFIPIEFPDGEGKTQKAKLAGHCDHHRPERLGNDGGDEHV